MHISILAHSPSVSHTLDSFLSEEAFRYAPYRFFLRPLAYTRGGVVLLDAERGTHIKSKIPPDGALRVRLRGYTAPLRMTLYVNVSDVLRKIYKRNLAQ